MNFSTINADGLRAIADFCLWLAEREEAQSVQSEDEPEPEPEPEPELSLIHI